MKMPFFEKSKKNTCKSNCPQISLRNVEEHSLKDKLKHWAHKGLRYIGDN
jgi:hypothetical protein